MKQYTEIGKVSNNCTDPKHIRQAKDQISKIIINPEFTEGLEGIEDQIFIDIVFLFHKSEGYSLQTHIFTGEKKGVFASRSPKRPNSIGVTTVKLINCREQVLEVSGLDAVNGTPVLDIKPCDNSIFEDEKNNNKASIARLKSNPRADIIKHINNNNTEQLLLEAGRIHGHFCPGLAMGIMAGMIATRELKAYSDGMEDVVAITETNNCFADGIQYLTGCTFGNNALIYNDVGKTAFTLATRNGKGVRICSKHNSREVIGESFPEFNDLYEKVVVEQNHDEGLKARFKQIALKRAFGTLAIPFEKLFSIAQVKVDLPGYAPIVNSAVCMLCGDSVMETKTIKKDDKIMCLPCAGKPFKCLDGSGIKCDQ